MAKTDNILTRGVPLIHKRKLERLAKKNRVSVNFIMLHAIDYYLGNDILVSMELRNGFRPPKLNINKIPPL